MQHPMFIRRIHKFFKPPRLAAIREAEKLKAAGANPKDIDPQIERLRNPDDVSYRQVYAIVAGAIIAAIAIVVIIVVR